MSDPAWSQTTTNPERDDDAAGTPLGLARGHRVGGRRAHPVSTRRSGGARSPRSTSGAGSSGELPAATARIAPQLQALVVPLESIELHPRNPRQGAVRAMDRTLSNTSPTAGSADATYGPRMSRRPGQPTKRSPERETAILNALRVGNTRRASARGAEITEDTLANWMRADPAFFGAVEHAEAEAARRFVGNIAKAAGNNWRAAAWWLERRRPADFGKRAGLELTGKGGGPVEVKAHPSAALTPAERAERLRGIADELDPAGG
jgi:hypothetical protein